MISSVSEASLTRLGARLRFLRLARNERQSDFAGRLGISVPTLRKVEGGDPSVAIGVWLDAAWLLDRLEDFEQVLAPKESLFDQWEQHKQPMRKRASKA